ncbi:MAG: phospho-sugar mutase [Chitinivibrionales bacterium]|nr:phospho-sugar mutase [Chitinivibrionales bacterium]
MEQSEIIKKAKEYCAVEKDPQFRQEVEDLLGKEDFEALGDRFYTELNFGTGGLRGIIGGGFNRMNPYIVQRATQGLANYIVKEKDPARASVVIAYDSRRFSDRFALQAACVCAGNGIKAYLFTGLRPTPELSFAVRHLKATAGIVLTASHNPAQYNGYKVYWEDGAQIVPPQDKAIVNEVYDVTDITGMSEKDAVKQGLLVHIDHEIDDAYIETIRRQALRPDLIRGRGSELSAVYTPLHGAGRMPLQTALEKMGITVTPVEEQKEPDGNFPTVTYPNPEEPSAMKMALELAEQTEADLVLGTDPDADRLGVGVPVDGSWVLLTGNQLGTLLLDYIVTTRKEQGTLPSNGAFVKTIVTTELQRLVAENAGLACYDTLTGFKYIGKLIRDFENMEKGPEYVFGGEESYGYLVGTSVRDKDAVSSAAMTAEMALYYRTKGMTLFDRLNQIYDEYGDFEEILISKYFTGEKGAKITLSIMDELRNNSLAQFAGQEVVVIKDYLDGTTLDKRKNVKEKDINLPSSNVLQYFLSDKTIVSVRPSGTEPKIKFYASCRSEPKMELSQAKEVVHGKITAVETEIDNLIDRLSHA